MSTNLKRRRYFYDTEFVEDGVTIRLLSIGVVCDDGREFYAVNSQPGTMFLAAQREWLRDNVMPHLPVTLISPDSAEGVMSPPTWRWAWNESHPDIDRVRAHGQIAHDLLAFLNPQECEPELWAYFGAYDHVAYAQLYGPMVNLPAGLPMATRDLLHLWEDAGRPEQPAQPTDVHNALADARWNRKLWQVCKEAQGRG